MSSFLDHVKQQHVIGIISMNLGVLSLSVIYCGLFKVNEMVNFASSLVQYVEYDCMGENWWCMLKKIFSSFGEHIF